MIPVDESKNMEKKTRFSKLTMHYNSLNYSGFKQGFLLLRSVENSRKNGLN